MGKIGSMSALPGHVKPNMHKMYDGRNVATRPIPVILDSGDMRAIASAAIQQRPLGQVVNFPATRHIKVPGVLGARAAGAESVNAGVYNPYGVNGNR